jgi:hypothetical protein
VIAAPLKPIWARRWRVEAGQFRDHVIAAPLKPERKEMKTDV